MTLASLPVIDEEGRCSGCGQVPTRELGNCRCVKEARRG